MTDDRIKLELDDIRALQYNWDGDEGVPPTDKIFKFVDEFLGKLTREQKDLIVDVYGNFNGTISVDFGIYPQSHISIEFGEPYMSMFGGVNSNDFTIDNVAYELFEIALTHINLVLKDLGD